MDDTSQALNDTLAQLGGRLDEDHQANVDNNICAVCQIKAELIPNPMHRPEPAQVTAARAWLDHGQSLDRSAAG